MPSYRRRNIAGGTYFFTVVTENRRGFLCTDPARSILHDAIADCLRERPFDPVAIVLLPDHLHAIWTLPAGDADFSVRWARLFVRAASGRQRYNVHQAFCIGKSVYRMAYPHCTVDQSLADAAMRSKMR